MIRNIVFDIGNVLISFRPADYLKKRNYPPALRDKILTDIFGSREWLMLDEGIITTPEAIDAIACNSSLTKAEILQIFNDRTSIFHCLDSNAAILPELKKEGFNLYYISNFPADIFDEVQNSYDFFSLFNGGIISAHVRSAKPDEKIFRIFFEKFGLNPRECFYIDDTDANVKAATAFGMKGYCTFGSTDISGKIKELIFNPGS